MIIRHPVIRIDADGSETRYKSIYAAAKELRPDNHQSAQRNIQSALAGRSHTAFGYRWRYAEVET